MTLVRALLPTLGEETLWSSARALFADAADESTDGSSAGSGATPDGPWVAETDLVKAFGLRRDKLREHVQRLRSMGLPIASRGDTAYRLTRRFDDLLLSEAVLPLLLEQVDPGLPWTAGLPYRYLPRCHSTSQILKQEAARASAGMAVVTDEQTEGRGRLGRSWVSGAGEDLTFSVLLQPLAAARAPVLSLTSALAVAEVLEEVAGLAGRVRVKWPNDVLLGDKKVCGILLESHLEGDRARWVVAGIGLNVNSDPRAMVGGSTRARREEWQGKAEPTSLRSESGRELARGSLLVRLLLHLTERWLDQGTESLLAGVRARDWLRGRRVEVVSGPADHLTVVAGEAAGIGPEGELMVRDDHGRTVPVFGGEATVSLRN